MPYTPPKSWTEVPAAVRAALADPFEKRADDGVPVLKHLADVMGWRAGELNANWGGPRPLTNLLIGSALGSLGGYGIGRLAENVLPERYFQPGGLRKRGLILGGLAGAAPAVWQGYDNYRQTGRLGSVAEPWPREHTKVAAFEMFDPVIDRNRFNQQVMGFDDTPLRVRAATTGIVEAASAVSGSDLVSPWDVAKIAVGAGAGLVSGMVAGKALGFLAGLTDHARDKIQQVGMWTGILNSVVPKALGLR